METLQEPSSSRYADDPAAVAGGSGSGFADTVPRDRAGTRPDQRSIPSLLRQLTEQVTTLFTTEMALARSELRQAIGQARAATISAASGALVLFGGFLVLLFAAVIALAEVVLLWQAALIVGGITAVVGLIMLYAGKRRLDPAALRPERTAEQLRRDREMAKAEFQHGAAR